MKVLIFHPVMLPARHYGGVERVVLWLARGLLELGHEVWIGALEGSELPTGTSGLFFKPEQRSAQDLLARLKAEGLQFEVVHFMAPPEPGVLSDAQEKGLFAAILTVHGNGKPQESFPENTVFLSKDHAARHGSDQFVYNGIDPDEVSFSWSDAKKPVLFFSKTSWKVKNVWGAFRIAVLAKVPLKIGGGNRPFLLKFLSFFTRTVEWVGQLGGEQKRRFYSEGSVFLFPVLWPEPFGLVLVEAMMAGLPVLASQCGSVSEIITPECGFVLPPPRDQKTESLWAQKLQLMYEKGDTLFDRAKIREEALRRFHYRVMAQNYVSKYQEVLAGKKLNSSKPMLQEQFLT